MTRFISRRLSLAVLLLVGLTFGAGAQAPDTRPARTVISANPFGLLANFFNAELERAITPASTAGAGGSTVDLGGERYVNADLFWRYYPSGRPFEGFALGVKAGITAVGDEQLFGYGFDANYSWLLGPTDRLYVGLGFGLKKLVAGTNDVKGYVPTFRIINVGFAF